MVTSGLGKKLFSAGAGAILGVGSVFASGIQEQNIENISGENSRQEHILSNEDLTDVRVVRNFGHYAESYPVGAPAKNNEGLEILDTFSVPGSHPLHDGSDFEYAIWSDGSVSRKDRPDLRFRVSEVEWIVNSEQRADFVNNGGLVNMSPEFVSAFSDSYQNLISNLNKEINSFQNSRDSNVRSLEEMVAVHKKLSEDHSRLQMSYDRLQREFEKSDSVDSDLVTNDRDITEGYHGEIVKEDFRDVQDKTGELYGVVGGGVLGEIDPVRGLSIGPMVNLGISGKRFGAGVFAGAGFGFDKRLNEVSEPIGTSGLEAHGSVDQERFNQYLVGGELNYNIPFNKLSLNLGAGAALRIQNTGDRIYEEIRRDGETLVSNSDREDSASHSLSVSGYLGATHNDSGFGGRAGIHYNIDNGRAAFSLQGTRRFPISK